MLSRQQAVFLAQALGAPSARALWQHTRTRIQAWSTKKKIIVGSTVGAATVTIFIWIWGAPTRAAKRVQTEYGTSIAAAARKYGVPPGVILTFISLESGGNIMAYNPEKSVMVKWACAVATDAKWKENPDYGNAVSVCNQIQRDPGAVAALAAASGKSVPYAQKAWKFGSFGLGQMSAITARDLGFSYGRRNSDLFIPEVNVDLVAKLIARLRAKFYPGRTALSLAEWSRVRSAYVGGSGIFDKNPTKAQEIADTFTARANRLQSIA